MKRIFFSLLTVCFLQVANGSILLYPYCGCGFFGDIAVEGIYVEEPDIGFYGLVDPDNTPAVVYDPSFLTARVGGTVGYTCSTNEWLECLGDQIMLYVSSSYFQCRDHAIKDLSGGSNIQLFSINGDGDGGEIPDTQESRFDSCIWENHTEAMLGGVNYGCYGINVHGAIGFGFIYRHQEYKSRLINPDIPFDNGTITEQFDTYYRGVKIELGVSKRFCQCWVFSVAPAFGIYDAHTDFCGNQTWGGLGIDPVSIRKTYSRTAYQGALRGALLWEWCGYYFGGDAFVDYLSYVPGVFNPREDDDGSTHLVEKNSFRYGGGLVAGKKF